LTGIEARSTGSLAADPFAELIVIVPGRYRNPRMSLAVNELLKVSESFFPCIFAGSPGPAGQSLQLSATFCLEGALTVTPALPIHPRTERKVVLAVTSWNPRMTLALCEPRQEGEPCLPSFLVGCPTPAWESF
jgi:hypothetical protein